MKESKFLHLLKVTYLLYNGRALMKWAVEYYDQSVQNWVNTLPTGIRASYARLASLLMEFGADLRLPHCRAMGGGLFELRLKGQEGIARVFYCMLLKQRVVMLHGFVKKTQSTPQKELKTAMRRMKEVKDDTGKT